MSYVDWSKANGILKASQMIRRKHDWSSLPGTGNIDLLETKNCENSLVLLFLGTRWWVSGTEEIVEKYEKQKRK